MSRPRISRTTRVSGRRGGRRSAPRSGDRTAFVARAMKKLPSSGSRNHRARQVRALLAERDELARRQPDQQAVVRARPGYVNISAPPTARRRPTRCAGWSAGRCAADTSSARDPELPDGERRARQHHELHEVAALDVLVLRPVDRKVLPPRRLRLGRREVRSDRDLLALECRRVETRPAPCRSALRGRAS